MQYLWNFVVNYINCFITNTSLNTKQLQLTVYFFPTSTIRYKGVGCRSLTNTSDSPWSFLCLPQTSECLQRILSFHACFIKTKIVSFSQLVFYLKKQTIAVSTDRNTRLKTNDEILIMKVTYLKLHKSIGRKERINIPFLVSFQAPEHQCYQN